jgi:VWFA-related protein
MRRQVAFLAAATLLLAAAGLAAQQATFRAKVELVLVDAVVVDKNGHAVRGLTASDFALTDRKTPQSIATFEEISHERPVSEDAVPALPPSLKLDVASNATVQTDRLVIVFIDDLHIWKGRRDKARALAQDVVTRLGPQTSMAVVFSSREGSTEVTQDRSTLLAAIEGMQARQTFRRPHQGFPKQGADYVPPEAPVEFKIAAVNKANRASLQHLYDNLQHFQSLEDAARMLIGEDRRRKAFVLISEGMAADLSILRGMSPSVDIVSRDVVPIGGAAASAVTDMLNELRRANITLYAIDPRGKVRAEDMMLESWPPPDCVVCENPPALPEPSERFESREDSQFKWNNPVRMAQDGLGFMTEVVGGFAVTDTDDLTGGLNRILEDFDHYYMLGFYPAATGGSEKTHAVDVTVPGHLDYTVRFRRGYTPDPSSRPPGHKDSLADLAAGVMPKGDLPLRLTALPLPGRGKIATVAVTLEVSTPADLLRESDNKLRDDINYSVMVVDGRKGKVTQRTGRSATFSMRGEEAGQPEPDEVTYQIPLTIDLEPGRYQLRASAISKKLGKGGSVYLDVTVPDFSNAPLALTAIAIGFFDGARVPVGRTTARARAMPGIERPTLPPAQERAQNGENPLPFEPTLRREFASSDAIRAYFEIVRRDTRSTTTVAVRIIDAGNESRLGRDLIVGPADHGRVDLGIPLETLSPGAYILRATATDSRKTTTVETGFIVR